MVGTGIIRRIPRHRRAHRRGAMRAVRPDNHLHFRSWPARQSRCQKSTRKGARRLGAMAIALAQQTDHINLSPCRPSAKRGQLHFDPAIALALWGDRYPPAGFIPKHRGFGELSLTGSPEIPVIARCPACVAAAENGPHLPLPRRPSGAEAAWGGQCTG